MKATNSRTCFVVFQVTPAGFPRLIRIVRSPGYGSPRSLSVVIESVIEHVLTRSRPSSGDDLLGFEIDADALLGDSDLLRNGEVKRTGDPRCMLSISAELAPEASTLRQVEDVLWTVWRDLQYDYFEATQLLLTQRAAELRFVTAIADNSFFVTGRIIVHGPHYERLARKQR